MKKVLIITEVFPPAFNPRMGYLARYLSAFRWDADIITENIVQENNFKFLVGDNRIVRVDLKNTYTPHSLLQKTWRLINLKRHFINNKYPFLQGIKLNFRKDDYSVILVSVAWRNLFILEASVEISKKWGIPLIIDLRDIYEQKPVLFQNSGRRLKDLLITSLQRSFEKRIIKLRNRALSYAKAVTTVSAFHVEQLSKFNNNVILINNGFDPGLFHPEIAERSDVFFIIYTGLVFSENEQDPTLLFEAVSQLERDGIINQKSFRIQFFTPVKFRLAILNHRLFPLVEKFIDFNDYVEFNKVPEILQRASIALVLTNNSRNYGPKGVLTTKFFDYLGAERPVLCVRSDEDILENIITKTNIGISARNTNDTYTFILEKWNEWKQAGHTTVKVNQEYKQRFSRKTQAGQFANLFETVIK